MKNCIHAYETITKEFIYLFYQSYIFKSEIH